MTLTVKSPISRTKAEYEGCAMWCIPRGVSSHRVLVRAFGDAYRRHENVRHAAFSFSRQRGELNGTGVKRRVENERGGEWAKTIL